MKAMKTIYKLSFILALFTIMSACEDDGDKIYLSGLESSKLMATETDVILKQETSAQLALSLAWTDNTLSVSDASVGAPNVFTTYIQVSTNSNFSSNVSESLEAALSKAYTGQELNTITKNLGAEPNVATTFYFRLKGSVGNNTEPVYSNIVPIDITPYLIDMTRGYILDKDQVDTERTLASPLADGIYRGFMGAAGWGNFYLKEGDGTIWGNDGVEGTAFLLSSVNDPDKRWNFWFPGMTGCYYSEVNTIKKQWSALYIPTLTVSGGIQGEMTFDRSKVRWTYVFDATSASTLNIKLNGAGKLYDYSTGTNDDAAAKDNPIAFAQSGDKIEMASQAGDISVNIPATGEVTLVVDLSDPFSWTCKVVSGSLEPVEVNKFVYIPGIDDNIRGSWTFDSYLSLYNEDNLAYAGVVNVDSQYGYGIYTESGNWTSFYNLNSGTAASGTLLSGGTTNIPAPAAGLYLITTSLKDLTYTSTAVGNSIYVVGMNDSWELNTTLSKTATVGVYQGSITINKASEYGLQILTDTSWSHKFGGADGKIYYLGSNITDDNTLAPGTYTMTVDLIMGTYSITQ